MTGRDLVRWEPGSEGKGLLVVEDADGELALRLWRTRDGRPTHQEAVQALMLHAAHVLACFGIDGVLFTLFSSGSVGERSYEQVIHDLDPRLLATDPHAPLWADQARGFDLE